MKLLAISGFKRSGKDTVAEYLVKNNGFTRVSFADPLKDLASAEFGVARTDFDNPEKKEAPILTMPVTPKDDFTLMLAKFMYREFADVNGKHPDSFSPATGFQGVFEENGVRAYRTIYHTPRSLAILKGSSNRLVSPNFWVNKAAEVIKNNNVDAVIPDLRYRSELSALKEAFGNDIVSIRINRFDNVNSNDPSELDLAQYEGFDYVVENKGTLEELFGKINEILKTIRTA